MKRVLLPAGVLAVAAAAAFGWAWATGRLQPGGPPNLVLVIGCTLRRDQLSPYGGLPEVSPFLSAIAENGAMFADGVTNGAWTKVGSTAVLTGQHPIAVGMVEPGDQANKRILSPQATTLAELLHNGGYETLGLTANPNLNRLFGFDQGYDDYFEASEFREMRTDKLPGREMVGQAMRMVEARKRPEAPLYLRMLLIDAHAPARVRK